MCFNLIAHIPLERVIYLQGSLPILHSEELCVKMYNPTCLHLLNADLSTWFVGSDTCGPHAHKEPLPSLEHITITGPAFRDDWNPLTNFLSHRAAVGNQISSLRLCVHPHIDDGVADSIKRVVNFFKEGYSDEEDGDEDDDY